MDLLGLTLGDWRGGSTRSAGLLVDKGLLRLPGVYGFSARCCGLKGLVPGARHTWISAYDGERWSTFEFTDEETLGLQSSVFRRMVRWQCHGDPSVRNRYHAPYASDRMPDGLWFGQAPRLECVFPSPTRARHFVANAAAWCADYAFAREFSYTDDNCSKLFSYLLWRAGLGWRPGHGGASRKLIGYRAAPYWSRHAACAQRAGAFVEPTAAPARCAHAADGC